MADVLDMIWHDYCSPDPYDVAAEAASAYEPEPVEKSICEMLDDILSQPNDIVGALERHTYALPERVHAIADELRQPSRKDALASPPYQRLCLALPGAWVNALVERARLETDAQMYLSRVFAHTTTTLGKAPPAYIPPTHPPAPAQHWDECAPYLAIGSLITSCGAGYAAFSTVEGSIGMRLLAGGIASVASWYGLTIPVCVAIGREQERAYTHACDAGRKEYEARKTWLDAVCSYLHEAYRTGADTATGLPSFRSELQNL